MNKLKRCVADLRFTNTFTRELIPDPRTPGEPLVRPTTRSPVARTPRQVLGAHFSYTEPDQTPNPVLVSASAPCAELLDIDLLETLKTPSERDAFLGLVSGNSVPAATNPWSLCYGGHQFGSWAAQLGDGRAITIGEVTNSRNEKWEVQLKGAGMTPYSRFADGYAVLRSSIREYLCSEAMHHLGVPTTRALSIVGSTRPVQRETQETGAVVCRLAPTWVRFGNFELFISRGDIPNMRKLADWVIDNHFADVVNGGDSQKGRYSSWLTDVVRRTAVMIAHWQAVGFCHGVMNTDNMSVLGLTLDYGPFQFLDKYDPEYICNHSDTSGRYSFDSQPGVGFWNLTKLASTISPLIVAEVGDSRTKAEETLREILATYPVVFHNTYRELMCKKLGLRTVRSDDLDEIITPLMDVLGKVQPDYSLFFRSLSTDFKLAASHDEDAAAAAAVLSAASANQASCKNRNGGASSSSSASSATAAPPLAGALEAWYAKYRARLLSELPASPAPVETAAADQQQQPPQPNGNINGTPTPTAPSSSSSTTSSPHSSPPAILPLPSSSSSSSSSINHHPQSFLAHEDALRTTRMKRANPKYILRNHLAQQVIEQAEQGDFNGVNELLRLLQDPFQDGTLEEQGRWAGPVPSWALELKLSCSS
ncbi:hypothetical protein HDU87_005563 [Geranomyces variabilis]|uniref:Selenoprotein O n=1 Tax=Geranomyces variabilis TaxID=109894 RepID=A0AAD5XR46_9FUNG|nr:hypothetical protein HDU87_005563 [Geranomyces variabilis]